MSACFTELATKLLYGESLLPSSTRLFDGFEDDPYFTRAQYQKLCNIVCEFVPGMSARDWWEADRESRIVLLQRAIDKGASADAKASRMEAEIPEAVWLGNGQIQIGDQPPFSIPTTFATAIEGLVELQSAETKALERRAGVAGVGKLLRGVVKQFAVLKPYIIFPGSKSKGGYRTAIRDGRKKNPIRPESAPE